MRIFKYHVSEPEQHLLLPTGAKVLTVTTQYGEPVMYALVDPNAPTEERTFRCIPTGKEFDPAGLTYIDTFTVEGNLVFHCFEEVQS